MLKGQRVTYEWAVEHVAPDGDIFDLDHYDHLHQIDLQGITGTTCRLALIRDVVDDGGVRERAYFYPLSKGGMYWSYGVSMCFKDMTFDNHKKIPQIMQAEIFKTMRGF